MFQLVFMFTQTTTSTRTTTTTFTRPSKSKKANEAKALWYRSLTPAFDTEADGEQSHGESIPMDGFAEASPCTHRWKREKQQTPRPPLPSDETLRSCVIHATQTIAFFNALLLSCQPCWCCSAPETGKAGSKGLPCCTKGEGRRRHSTMTVAFLLCLLQATTLLRPPCRLLPSR